MHYKISQLILTPGQKSSTISEIFLSQPDAQKENLGGKLWLLIEIEINKNNSLKIINFLIDNLNNNYYYNEKMALRERIGTIKIEQIFESVIAKTNKDLAEFIRREKIKINLDLINATAGVIFENNIHFSNIGKNKALLIYPDKNVSIKESSRYGISPDAVKYKISDIIEQSNGNKKSSLNINKIFSSVISGKIPPRGYMLFTNETLPEYLTNKHIIEVITTLPPDNAAGQFKNELLKINAYVSFLALIIKNTTGASEPEIKIKLPATKESIPSLNSVEQTTEKLLSTSGMIKFNNLKNIINKTLSIFNFKSKKTDNKISVKSLKNKMFFETRAPNLRLKKIWRSISNVFIFAVNFLIYFVKLITSKEKMIGLAVKFKEKIKNLKQIIFKFISWFKNLKKGYQISFIMAIGFILLFLFNTFSLNIQNKNEIQINQTNEIISLIEQRQNQVEASMIYGNEESAKILLEEINGLLGRMPRKTDEQISKYSEFKKNYDLRLEKIRHVIDIADANEIADFINLNNQTSPANIVMANNKIYASDIGQKSIYTLDLNGNLITSLADLNLPGNMFSYPFLDKNGNIYFINSNNAIIQIDKKENINLLKIDLNGQLNYIKGASFYNNRLYSINGRDNQIYRYDMAGKAFLPPVAWIKGQADFSNAVSMDIDGTIYVLFKNGQVNKYLKGSQEEFNLKSIDPEFTEASKIIVSPILKYIYILESKNNRLAVFDKNGEFLLQYRFSQMNDIKDFIVDEANKKIYVLNNTSIFEIPASHFDK